LHPELLQPGRKFGDHELKGYILCDLDRDYTIFVAPINTVPAATLLGMCAQLQAYDSRQTILFESR
jgi:hypothetical protein